MKKLMLICLLLYNVGCATTPDTENNMYVKKNITNEIWNKDYLECQYDAKKAALQQTPNTAGAPNFLIYPTIYKNLLCDCMVSRGYRLVPKGTLQSQW